MNRETPQSPDVLREARGDLCGRAAEAGIAGMTKHNTPNSHVIVLHTHPLTLPSCSEILRLPKMLMMVHRGLFCICSCTQGNPLQWSLAK